MCLAQFATHYICVSKFPKKVPPTFEEDGNISDQKSDREIFSNGKKLPKYLDMTDSELGKMSLRGFPSVMRLHDSKKKEGHEQFFAEMLLYYPWRDEDADLSPENPEKCVKDYNDRIETIDINKKGIFPKIDTMSHLLRHEEYQPELELQKPHHIYDLLDSQREQEKSDDIDTGVTDDPLFASRNPIGQELSNENDHEQCKYKQISLPTEAGLLDQTRKLAPEQLELLEDFVEHCKNLKKQRNNLEVPSIAGMLAICHGGAGVGKSTTIRVISLWVEKILRSPGQNPNHPRVIICAPTGKAASLISKYSHINL